MKRKSLVFIGNLINEALKPMLEFKTNDIELANVFIHNIDVIKSALKDYNRTKTALDKLRENNKEVFDLARQKVNENQKIEFNKLVEENQEIFDQEDNYIVELKEMFMSPITIEVEMIDSSQVKLIHEDIIHKIAFMLPLQIDPMQMDHSLTVEQVISLSMFTNIGDNEFDDNYFIDKCKNEYEKILQG